ncbi:MAG: acyl-CoA dehydrogenase family protein [Candidatus Tectomicrobia bacterium]|uniref:Acyl-CoA dehydrogenase family protein n=1 Tax=Tectimicrobiota bacterium TaxID=2528274 RepID=A0A932CMG3_UNCTE|nr:acyl-CoA dehydrogenase family protein [Candidatus Tectomicrobia bacterium]
MIDFSLTEEQRAIQKMARDFAEREIRPKAVQYDRALDPKECFPWEIVRKGGQLGFNTMEVPKSYGGPGFGDLEMALVCEELGWGDAGVATTFAACMLGLLPIIRFGTPAQKDRFLPPLLEDEAALIGLAATEPGSGSDGFGLGPVESGPMTRAERDGDDYVLNGTKRFITNGGVSRLYTVMARTDPKRSPLEGVSAFIVPSDTPGLSIGKIEDKMGQRLGQQSELVFEEMRVPRENLLGVENGGATVLFGVLPTINALVGALATGLARAAYEASVEYAKVRVQGGKPIIHHQAISLMLADMKMKIDAARHLVWNCCWYHDAHPGAYDLVRGAMAKVYPTDVAMEVTTNAVQIFSGYGYMRDYPVEKYMRDAKLTQIYDGTNQILRFVIASEHQQG